MVPLTSPGARTGALCWCDLPVCCAHTRRRRRRQGQRDGLAGRTLMLRTTPTHRVQGFEPGGTAGLPALSPTTDAGADPPVLATTLDPSTAGCGAAWFQAAPVELDTRFAAAACQAARAGYAMKSDWGRFTLYRIETRGRTRPEPGSWPGFAGREQLHPLQPAGRSWYDQAEEPLRIFHHTRKRSAPLLSRYRLAPARLMRCST